MMAATAAILVAANLPRLLGYLLGPPRHRFLGQVWGYIDLATYAQVVADAARGAWLWTDRMAIYSSGTLISHGPYLEYTPYLVLGHLLTFTGWDPLRVIELARLPAQVLCLGAAWLFVKACLPSGQRLLAYLAASVGGGLGWLLLARPVTPLGRLLPLDFGEPSFNLLNAMHMAPHVALAVAGLAIYGWGMVESARGRWRGLWGAVALGVVASFHAFIVPMALLAGLAFVLWRARNRQAVLYLALAALLAGIFVAYALWVRLHDPVFASGQPAQPENLISLLMARALLWPFIALGAWRAVRGNSLGLAFAVCWAASALTLDFAPGFEDSQLRRTVEGSSLAYGVLAATGLQSLGGVWRNRIIALCLVTPLVQVALLSLEVPSNPELYLSTGDYQLAGQLDAMGYRGRVLATPVTMRWVAALSRASAYDHYERAGPALAQLVATGAAGRAAQLDHQALLFWGEQERRLYGQAPGGLQVVARAEGSLLLAAPSSP